MDVISSVFFYPNVFVIMNEWKMTNYERVMSTLQKEPRGKKQRLVHVKTYFWAVWSWQIWVP